MHPRITLEQWQALIAVVDAGGYARAAERLHKSQSAVTYLIKRLEEQLGVKAFDIQGRKAVLTPVGQMLLLRGRYLLQEALSAEQAARSHSASWEPVIRIAAEIIFPTELLLSALDELSALSPATNVEVFETVLSGTHEALTNGSADIAITPQIPSGFLGEPLMPLELIAVAHPEHPLHKLGRRLTVRDLRAHRHLLVRDTGSTRTQQSSSVDIERRWVFSHFDSSIKACVNGAGFAWYPKARIGRLLKQGLLAPLPLGQGTRREHTLYLVTADPDGLGPAARALVEVLRRVCVGAAT